MCCEIQSAWGGERPRPSSSSSSGRGTRRPQSPTLHCGPFRTQKCEPVAAGFEPTRTLCSGCHRSIISRFKSTSLTIACEEFHARTNDQKPLNLSIKTRAGEFYSHFPGVGVLTLKRVSQSRGVIIVRYYCPRPEASLNCDCNDESHSSIHDSSYTTFRTLSLRESGKKGDACRSCFSTEASS